MSTMWRSFTAVGMLVWPRPLWLHLCAGDYKSLSHRHTLCRSMWSALTIWIAASSIAGVATTAVPVTVSVETRTTVTMATSQDPNITQQSTILPITTATNSTHANFTSAMMTSAGSLTTAGGTAQTPPQAGGVPAWGIALLVLAAVVLLLLLLLLIGLLVWCCCTRGRYKHPDDVPLYTTHSRFWHSSVGAYEDVDKPVKMAAK
ncbi:uncharacterized protein LOC129185254 [Dunckerocampus dactyliophorus]|uniref:uncharacterized protein LOC129185254 n=1 Tax=Dunckerocampus dactyliophorus TaxID=161453 RepID=UPI002405958D|nr:uncharacterized protein LOC129185254 [Dunckerocampus dactyliophorus]